MMLYVLATTKGKYNPICFNKVDWKINMPKEVIKLEGQREKGIFF